MNTIKVEKPKRWSSPFDKNMNQQTVEKILKLSPFSQMDPNSFPKSLSLKQIVRNDMRIRKFKKGDLVIRVDDYGNSAFLILVGEVAVILPPGLDESLLGRSHSEKKQGFFTTIKKHFKQSDYPEVRIQKSVEAVNTLSVRNEGENAQIYFDNVDELIGQYEVHKLYNGEMFGEVAALARTPRNTSIIATSDIELLEIRWQAIRDIRRQVESFKEYIDELYRSRNLITHLKEINLFKHLNKQELEELAEQTIFESYGNFDWHLDFKSVKKSENIDIVSQGDYIDYLLFIRSGFAKIIKATNNQEKIITTLSQGEIFGLQQVINNINNPNQDETQVTYTIGLASLGYTDILRVPVLFMENKIFPNVPQAVLKNELKKQQQQLDTYTSTKDNAFLEFCVDKRYINGTATMMIDLNRCVKCDECVHACANSHNGNPRFVRHGTQHQNQMIVNSCMHCIDPVCMIGCPTGAIHRSKSHGEVVINDTTCIGCGTCANSCPYDNIRLVEIRDQSGAVLIDSDSSTTVLKATKCDLCSNLPHGPACQEACPHDALVRIDMGNSIKLSNWINR